MFAYYSIEGDAFFLFFGGIYYNHLGQERYKGGALYCQGALGSIGQHITISDKALHIMDSDELLLLPI